MELAANKDDKSIRKIEDIIEILKCKGNFSVRQVAFALPSDDEQKAVPGIAKSLESGLSKTKTDFSDKKKIKKVRSSRHKSPVPDVVTWPSDSDITVLRMKLCLNAGLEEKGILPGDGLHQPDDSSMVNLATLMHYSQSASKHSVNIEEYLLPLSSWERDHDGNKVPEDKNSSDNFVPANQEFEVFEAVCNRTKDEKFSWTDSEVHSVSTPKAKIARFLRLYFCPCCSCLYNIENNIKRDKLSVYSTHSQEDAIA